LNFQQLSTPVTLFQDQQRARRTSLAFAPQQLRELTPTTLPQQNEHQTVPESTYSTLLQFQPKFCTALANTRLRLDLLSYRGAGQEFIFRWCQRGQV
jgi:hypothetical protein